MKNNGGMTLVEVLVAMAIVFIIFLGMSSGGLLVLDQNLKNTQRDEAVSVAEMEMQRIRNLPFDNLAIGVTTQPAVPRVTRGLTVTYTVTDNITVLDANNRQVAVDVGWTRWENRQQKTYSHKILTIVRSN